MSDAVIYAIGLVVALLGLGFGLLKLVEWYDNDADDEEEMVFGLGGLMTVVTGIVCAILLLMSWWFGWGVFGYE